MTEIEDYDEFLQSIPEEYKTESFMKVFDGIKNLRETILSLKEPHEKIQFFLNYIIEAFSWFTESLKKIKKEHDEKCNDCLYKKAIKNIFPTKELIDLLRKTAATKTFEKDIYFIKSEEGFVKIGISYKPERRLKQLQQNTRYKLTLLHIISKGGIELEKELHERFSKYYIIWEWFKAEPELLNYIRKIKRRGGFTK